MRVGILSFAHHHAETYIKNLLNHPDVELVGVADEDAKRGKEIAELHDTKFVKDYDTLLKESLDGVLVCSENAKHPELVKMAASAGANVLCEKPLATTDQAAKEMVEACNKAGVFLMTAFPMRFSVPAISVKQQIDKGTYGEIYCFNSANQGELPKKYRTWFVDPVLAGGGALVDHTVHLLDMMRWFLNDEVKEVYAQTNHVFHKDETIVETGGILMVTFKKDTFASIDFSWSRPDFWPTWGGLNFEMVTERGAIMVDAFSQTTQVYSEELQRPFWQYWGSDSNQGMINEFVNAFKEERQPMVTGVDGLRAVEVVTAAYESARTGKPILL